MIITLSIERNVEQKTIYQGFERIFKITKKDKKFYEKLIYERKEN